MILITILKCIIAAAMFAIVVAFLIPDSWKRQFWRHQWIYPANGNPYRRRCAICGEQQEWDNGYAYETPGVPLRWTVFNAGDHAKHTNPITRERWISECATRFMERVKDMERREAMYFAVACFDNLNGDLTECPVEAADEELSCWTD